MTTSTRKRFHPTSAHQSLTCHVCLKTILDKNGAMRHHWNRMHPELSFPTEFEDHPLQCNKNLGHHSKRPFIRGTSSLDTSSFSEHSINNCPIWDEDNSLPLPSQQTTSFMSDDDTQEDVTCNDVDKLSKYIGFEIDASSKLGDRLHVNIQKEHLSYLRLYKFCISNGTSLGFLDDFLVILKKEMMENKFDPTSHTLLKRDSMLRRYRKNVDIPRPVIKYAQLTRPNMLNITEPIPTVPVHTFPFVDQMKLHLKDQSIYGDLNNLVVNKDNPFSQYKPCSDDEFTEILDGDWYGRTYKKINPKSSLNDFIMPAIIYIDKTGVFSNQRKSLEPVMMSFATISSARRQDPNAWFCLGYIPDTKSIEKKLKKNDPYSLKSTSDIYHTCLLEILKSFIDAQKQTSKIVFPLQLGNTIRVVRLHFPLAMVIGDGLNGDGLCARVQSYGRTSRLSRRCFHPSSVADQPSHTCFMAVQGLLDKLCMAALGPIGSPFNDNHQRWLTYRQSLPRFQTLHSEAAKRRSTAARNILMKALKTKICDNAFRQVDFGDNTIGIPKATVVDSMHSLDIGIIKHITRVFFDLMPASLKDKIDALANKLLTVRSSVRQSYPRITFSNGYTSLTLLTAVEHVGVLLGLAILLHSRKGREVLAPRFEEDFDELREKRRQQFLKMDNANRCINSEESIVCMEEDFLTNTIGKEENEITVDDECSIVSHNSKKKAVKEAYIGSLEQERRISNSLKKYDLAFVETHLIPTLPKDVSTNVKGIVWDTLASLKTDLSLLKIPKGILDYDSSILPDVDLFCQPIANNHDTKFIVENSAIPPHDGAFKSIGCSLDEFQSLCEKLLSFQAFCSYGTGKKHFMGQHVADVSLNAVEKLLSQIRLSIRRDIGGCGWKIQKYLDLQHLPNDMREYGPISGFNASQGERGLKMWAKFHAQTVQKQSQDCFEEQVCSRILDLSLLSTLTYDDNIGTSSSMLLREETNSPLLKSRLSYIVVLQNRAYSANLLWNKTTQAFVEDSFTVENNLIHESILLWFHKSFGGKCNQSCQRIIFQSYSELRKESITLRSHPKYRGHEWYDFCKVSFEWQNDDGTVEGDMFPSKLVGFFKQVLEIPAHKVILPGIGGEDEFPIEFTLVHPCAYQKESEKNKSTDLIEHWTLDNEQRRGSFRPKYQAVAHSSIGNPCFVVEEEKGLSLGRPSSLDWSILMLTNRQSNWPSNFLKSGIV